MAQHRIFKKESTRPIWTLLGFIYLLTVLALLFI